MLNYIWPELKPMYICEYCARAVPVHEALRSQDGKAYCCQQHLNLANILSGKRRTTTNTTKKGNKQCK